MKPALIKSAEMEQFLGETRGLERDYLSELRQGQKRAYRVAGAMAVIAVMALAGGMYGMARPAPEPLVLRVDSATGAVDRVTKLGSVVQHGEVVDRYWLNRYVLSRESYDYNTIATTYTHTGVMSSEDVQQEFYSLYRGPTARDAVLGANARIVATVRSITRSDNDTSAVVRFSTQTKHSNGTIDPPKNLIATIGYRYTSAPMLERDRLINPLGFQVASYRVDPEVLINGQ